MRPLGEDVSEMLDMVPGYFKVIRHVRPKLSCGHCSQVVQQPAPPRPIARGMAAPGLLALVGRERELAELERVWRAVTQGSGAAAVVRGGGVFAWAWGHRGGRAGHGHLAADDRAWAGRARSRALGRAGAAGRGAGASCGRGSSAVE